MVRRQSLGWIVAALALLLALPVMAQDSTPGDTITTFYNDYLNNPGLRAAADYPNADLMTGALQQRLDALRAEGELRYDPLVCGQDLPQRYTFEILSRTGDTAIVLMSRYFRGDPQPYNMVLDLALEDGVWKLDGIQCFDDVTPGGVTELFYNSYAARVRSLDESAEEPGDALDARLYREFGFLLSGSLVDLVDRQVDAGSLVADPLLCAQDAAISFSTDVIAADDTSASVMVSAFFTGSRVPQRFMVNLRPVGIHWQITSVRCDAPPEALVSAFYQRYASFAAYDMDYGIERTPLVDWGYNWLSLLDDALWGRLTDRFTSGQPRLADPVLCAQDLPDRLHFEAINPESSSTISVQVRGDYRSGPDSYTTYDLATVETAPVGGAWRLIDITCGQ